MNVTATLRGDSVTIVDITPTGNNSVLVSYVDSDYNLLTTIFNFDPKTANTVTIATGATVV
jgi:hypothetical protein